MNEQIIKEKLEEIDNFVKNKKHTDAVFTSYNVIKDICKIMLQKKEIKLLKKQNVVILAKQNYKEDNRIIDLLNKVNIIVRKYDYDYMDVFDEKDAKLMRKYMTDFYYMI